MTIFNVDYFGKRLEGCSFDNFVVSDDNKDAYDASIRFSDGKSNGIILMGKPGRGKTHLLISIAKKMNRHEVSEIKGDVFIIHQEANSIMYWPVNDFIRSVVRSIGTQDCDSVIEWCVSCDVLLVDDLGSERGTDFTEQTIKDVFHRRYRAGLPVGISTNLDKQELIDRYDIRSMSRWAEDCEFVTVRGPDYRVKKRDI